jgi:hypothetical protein
MKCENCGNTVKLVEMSDGRYVWAHRGRDSYCGKLSKKPIDDGILITRETVEL